MVQTRNNLDLSKLSIHQVISNQTAEEKVTSSSMSNQNNNMDNLYNTSTSCQSIKADFSTLKTSSSSFTPTDAIEMKMIALSELDNQMLKTIPTSSQTQPINHSINSNEDKELARIPYYNGNTNIYAWLTAIKSAFIDLNYDESTWANKAKYYLLDHAAQFVYVNDDQMTNWKDFQKLMIDRYSPIITTQGPMDSPVNALIGSCTKSQPYTTCSSDTLAVKAHYALVLEDLKTLPRFSNTDKCYCTLKLLSNIDDKWLEFMRRQKLDWNNFKRKLISQFEGKKDPSRIELEDAIRNRRYHDNESMHQYYSDIMRQCDLLETEYTVSDRHRSDYIIRGLPDSIQDQVLIREYSTPKELLEVLQKIEERRKRTNFEQHSYNIISTERVTTVTNDELDNPYADTDTHNQFRAVLKCDKCRQPIECIGYCIIICETLVHHEPAITAPLLMDIIETIGRVAASHRYAWQENSTVVALTNSTSTAQQFIHYEKSLHTVALSWNDFPEFNSIIAPKWLPNDINEQKCLSLDISTTLPSNIAQFMEYISIDSPIQLWTSAFLEFDFLFDKLTRIYTTIKSSTPINYGLTSILRIMMSILQVLY
ncbi:unnamed protein product [Rotaria sp. Silwood2]|nr:unnamed protein product [Rotaria sp. Silwood2]